MKILFYCKKPYLSNPSSDTFSWRNYDVTESGLHRVIKLLKICWFLAVLIVTKLF